MKKIGLLVALLIVSMNAFAGGERIEKDSLQKKIVICGNLEFQRINPAYCGMVNHFIKHCELFRDKKETYEICMEKGVTLASKYLKKD